VLQLVELGHLYGASASMDQRSKEFFWYYWLKLQVKMASGRWACRTQRILLQCWRRWWSLCFWRWVSLMILIVTSACRNPMLNCWHPGWRTRTSSLC